MSGSEPPRWTIQRQQRMAQQYPELTQADAKRVMQVDNQSVSSGQPPSPFSETAMRLAAFSAEVPR